jgi:hypothetical protein
MARAAKRPPGSWTYVLQSDRELPESEQSRFTLRPLTGAERERATDDVTRQVFRADGSVETISRMRTVARELALSHIESVENFPAGAPKPWPNGTGGIEARQKFLEELADEHTFELGNEIYLRSTLGPEEKKTVGESSPPAPISS